ncbi:chemerin-like receptor 1 [Ambystoma mexicanum]|uniref:chemerin-like receptor 1 n=1 Tax=Ambystoma mexicanum TaxID=8296 RepID=UPI0037E7A943
MNGTLLTENATIRVFSPNTTTQPLKMKRINCEDFSDFRKSMQTLSLLFYSLAFLLGVTGNGLVIWITGFRMKKTVNTVWFLNLSIADFILTFSLPLGITYTAMNNHWPFGTILCKIISMVGILNLYASIFFLVVISVDRCLMVAYPVWSQNNRTPRMARLVAMTTWIVALAFSLPALVFRDTLTGRGNTTFCFNNYNFTDPQIVSLAQMRKMAMSLTSFICGFLIPFIVIFFCYSVLTCKLKRSQLAKSSKPFRIMCAVVLSFFLCWLPTHIFMLIEMGLKKESSCLMKRAFLIGSPVVSSIAYFNSCINPIIYVFIVRDFKEMLRTSILSVLETAFKEEPITAQSRSTSVQQEESNMNMILPTR